MKILFLGEAISPHLLRWHKEFERLGWETVTASCDYLDDFSGVRLVPSAGAGPARYLSIVGQVEQLIKELQPHLINSHYLPTYGLTAAMVNVHPLALTLWGSDILISGKGSLLRKMRSRFVLRRADLVVADAQSLIDEANAIAPSKRQLVVSFGVPQEWIKSGAARTLTEVDTVQIISVRKFEKLYDVATLIRAAKHLADDGFPFHLTLVGSGSEDESLEALTRQLGLDSHVTFTGAVTVERISTLLRRVDIYVSTSRSDSTSVSLLEAMSQKLYPVVTDIPGNREWLESERFLFPVGDAKALAEKIKQGRTQAARVEAYDEYKGMLRQKGIREDQMRIADMAFRKLIDEYRR